MPDFKYITILPTPILISKVLGNDSLDFHRKHILFMLGELIDSENIILLKAIALLLMLSHKKEVRSTYYTQTKYIF